MRKARDSTAIINIINIIIIIIIAMNSFNIVIVLYIGLFTSICIRSYVVSRVYFSALRFFLRSCPATLTRFFHHYTTHMSMCMSRTNYDLSSAVNTT